MSQFCPECKMRGLCDGDIAGVVSIGTVPELEDAFAITESREVSVIVDKEGMPSQPFLHPSGSMRRQTNGWSNSHEIVQSIDLLRAKLNRCYQPQQPTRGSFFRRNTGRVACGALETNLMTPYDYELRQIPAERLEDLKTRFASLSRAALYRAMAEELRPSIVPVG